MGYGLDGGYQGRPGGYPPLSAPKLFDGFSTTNLGVWSMRKEITSYTGYCVRADDNATSPLDIGFDGNGDFDMAAYSAYGGGSERIVTWYDQSGNGFDLTRAYSATLCPIVQTSAHNGDAAIYFNGQGSLGDSAFTNWNGLADANFYGVIKPASAGYTGYTFVGGGSSRGGYAPIGAGTPSIAYWFTQGFSQYNTFDRFIYLGGQVLRWHYDGGGATDLLQARFYVDGVELAGTSGAAIGTTLPNETGFYVGGNPAGGAAEDTEIFAVYYLGYDITAGQDSQIVSSVTSKWLSRTDYNLFCLGDSLTYGVGTASPPTDSNTYPAELKTLLEADTGKTWTLRNIANTSEPGAQTDRVLQINVTSGNTGYYYDLHAVDNIALVWCGTNDYAAGDADTVALDGNLDIVNALYDRGFTVYVLNMLPRTDLGAGNAAFETKRTTFNSSIASTVSGKATVIDIASDPNLDDADDATYYAGDGVHLSGAGYDVVAGIVSAIVEANL